MWEDENCKDGGRWSFRVPKTHTNKYWEDLVLAMVGEQFSEENEINGLVIALRPTQDTISIWNKHGRDEGKINAIKQDLERILKIDEHMKLEYEIFEEALNKAKEDKPHKEAYNANNNNDF